MCSISYVNFFVVGLIIAQVCPTRLMVGSVGVFKLFHRKEKLLIHQDTWKADVLRNLYEKYFLNCSIIFASYGESSLLNEFLRLMNDYNKPERLIDLRRFSEDKEEEEKQKIYIDFVLKDFPIQLCLTMINDLDGSYPFRVFFRVLKLLGIKKMPEMKLVMFGSKIKMEVVISNIWLQNTINIIYIAPENSTFEASANPRPNIVSVYGRCFFCSNPRDMVFVLEQLEKEDNYQITENIFPGIPSDFQGTELKITALNWEPFTEVKPLTSKPCSEAIIKESVSGKILKTMAQILNFTYIIHEPCEKIWGNRSEDGNWNGILGDLQSERADFTLLLAPFETRLKVADFTRPYENEPLTFVASKPKFRHKSFALVKAFTGWSWFAVTSLVFIGSLCLFAFTKDFSNENQTRTARKISDCFFTIVKVILFASIGKLPKVAAANVFLGIWFLGCMVLVIFYQSSLLVSISFPIKSHTLDYASDLVKHKDEWTWGYEPTPRGTGYEFFKDNSLPLVQELNKYLEISDVKSQMEKVLQGNHAFFTYYYTARLLILKNFTNEDGNTPLYIGEQRFFNHGGYCWGFRKGAPYLSIMDKNLYRLIESGLVGQWLERILEKEAKISRRKENNIEEIKHTITRSKGKVSGFFIVLSLEHLRGVFGIYFFGCLLSFLSFCMEISGWRSCHFTRSRK